MTRLVLISGSMAAGKSTLSRALTHQLRAGGWSVALTSLDEVADMARPTLPTWDWAHEIHAQLVGQWVGTGIDIVVDEGTSTVAEVEQVLSHLPRHTDVFHVVAHTTYDHALRRVQDDPTRGLSKDPDFLHEQYEGFARELPHLPCDLLLDTGSADVTTLTQQLLAVIAPHAGNTTWCNQIPAPGHASVPQHS